MKKVNGEWVNKSSWWGRNAKLPENAALFNARWHGIEKRYFGRGFTYNFRIKRIPSKFQEEEF